MARFVLLPHHLQLRAATFECKLTRVKKKEKKVEEGIVPTRVNTFDGTLVPVNEGSA